MNEDLDLTEPIQTEQYREFTINEYQGAVVVFTGHVREWTKGVKNGIFRI